MEVALLWLFLRKGGFSKLPVFTKKHLIVSVLLIVSGTFWCKPVKLAWFDVPLNYTYRFEAETESGQTLQLPPKFFAPFDNQITLSRFGFLDGKKPTLGIVWGAGPAEIMKINSADEAFALERSKGHIRFNAIQTKDFDAFLKQHTQNWNKRLSKDTWLGFLPAPRFIWTYPTETFDQPEPIKRINIVQITTFYDNVSYAEIRKEKVHEVVIY
jgi:hypothetical protein